MYVFLFILLIIVYPITMVSQKKMNIILINYKTNSIYWFA